VRLEQVKQKENWRRLLLIDPVSRDLDSIGSRPLQVSKSLATLDRDGIVIEVEGSC